MVFTYVVTLIIYVFDNPGDNMPEQDDTDDWPLPKQFSMDVAFLPPRRSTRTSRPVNRYTPVSS